MSEINWGEAVKVGLIAFGGTGGVLMILILISRAILAKGFQPYTHLLKAGIPAQAEIMLIQPTRVKVKDQQIVEMQLEVTGPNGSYETFLKLPVPIDKLIQLQPGTIIPAKIDPTDQRKIAIDISNI